MTQRTIIGLFVLIVFIGCHNGEMMKAENEVANRLIDEMSPYLLQHAHNPVDWYPWGDEAFSMAEKEDKPIFLSIGYSTCHWCHVMAHESFEDQDVANLLNEGFVSIKVDREERPDIDGIYMTVAQLLTGRGGWPLTIIMTPDAKPFYAATYLPKESRSNQVGMLDLLPRIMELWREKRSDLTSSAESITAALNETAGQNHRGDDLDGSSLNLAFTELDKNYDDEHGGFGSRPKFPTPHNLTFLLRYWQRTGNSKALEIVENTLARMRRGGLFDHVGFGFHRYSTDSEWLLPHFEKMLYDQALLAMAYLEAYQATGKRLYASTAEEIFTYVLRDMRDSGGGFHSAENADSEGEEGKFYIWTQAELENLLGEHASVIGNLMGVTAEGNFLDEATGRKTGANILHIAGSIKGTESSRQEEELAEIWRKSRKTLFEAREERIRPSKDDKVLTDWNGLMIAAMARGGRILGRTEYTEAAAEAAEFIFENMTTKDGRLFHMYRNGNTAVAGQIDDYAFFLWGVLELYQSRHDAEYLAKASDLASYMIEDFRDDETGGFYAVADQGEALLVRQKESIDGAIPSGNSVAMLALSILSRLTGQTDREEMAIEIGAGFSALVKKIPQAHTQMMTAVDFLVGPTHEVVIVGDPKDEDTREMLNAFESVYVPRRVLIVKDPKHSDILTQIAPFTEYMRPIDGRATAYVCTGFTCDLPTTDPEKMLELLSNVTTAGR